MRVKNQHAQLRVRGDCLVEEQRYGRRLADACGADDREVFGEHRGNMDGGVETFVLRELADDAAVRLTRIVDAREVTDADPMGNSSEIGVAADAGGKRFPSIRTDLNLAHQFHFDAESVTGLFAPTLGNGLHRVDQGHDAVGADGNRDQFADRPELGKRCLAVFGNGCDRRARTVAADDTAEKAITGLQAIAAIHLAGARRQLISTLEQSSTSGEKRHISSRLCTEHRCLFPCGVPG